MYAPRTARLAQRTALNAARNGVRAPLRSRQQLRRATTEAGSSSTSSSVDSKAIVGGLVGGGAVLLTGYTYYRYSGLSTIVDASKKTKAKLDSVTTSIQASAPPANEALRWLHNTALSYASFIPGARHYIDTAFKDLEMVQEQHGEEVQQVVERVYGELKSAAKDSKKQSVMNSVQQVWEILEKGMGEIAGLAGDSAEDIMKNHPALKEKLGGSIEQFQSLASGLGGEEVKMEVRETMSQVKDIITAAGSGSLSLQTVDQIKKLVQEKSEKVKKLGEQAWKKGYEQAKPYLDKQPAVKKLVEENLDTLKNGNVSEALSRISDAVYSGNVDDLKSYIDQAGKKVKNKTEQGNDMLSKGLQYAMSTMSASGVGGEILPRVQELVSVAEKRGQDAEEILRGTWEDIVKVLQKRQQQIEKLAEEAKQEGKQKASKR